MPDNRTKEKNKILKDLFNYYNLRTKKLVQFLYEQRYSMSDVAAVLDVTRQAIAYEFPKSELLKEIEQEKQDLRDDHMEGDK